MKNLERRALLGDRQAQEECTRRRIVLPCPWCKCNERDMLDMNVYHEQYFYSCEACGCNGPVVRDDNCDYPEHDALAAWNTRPAPPIGRCGECKHSTNPAALTMIYGEPGTLTCHHGPCNRRNVNKNDFCSYFEPKEEK